MTDESVFAAAGAIPDPKERAAYLDRACPDPAVRREIEALLAAHDASNPLDRSPSDLAVTGMYESTVEQPGSRVGPYKLLQQIGEGGMGTVFVAEQEEPVRRRVALKIVKPGMDSKQVVARFEAERQALSMMDHPNIARVLDAGTTASGRPFFVMELVHGVPITEFCDANKLTPRERLELFVPVCQAIQHAHMKGVIHRDVKPSNVLVTMYDDKPVPKVIDFGVAKAVEQRLTEKTLFTQFGTLVGTFEYMSPEQAEMNALGVDTRSDVYSLGVLLYELLTGTTPLERPRLRAAALGEVVRLIREEEPPRPSQRLSTSGTLAKVAAARKTEPGKLPALVRGELDWIVMKALEKDRARRYETASGFAADVQRYLTGEQVQAVPPSAGYRLRKFARKNRAIFTTATAFVGLTLTAAAISTWLAVQANHAEASAEEKRRAADNSEREATIERNRADREAAQAKHNAHEALLALNWMRVAKGLQLADEGRFFSAMPFLVQPLEQEGSTPEEQEAMRTRIASYLRYASGRPRLRQMFFFDKQLSKLGSGHWDRPQIAFSSDGKRLLAIAEDVVYLWSLQRGTLIAALEHPQTVQQALFSTDGTRVVTASADAAVRTWNAANGRPLGSPFRDLAGIVQQAHAVLPMGAWQAVAHVAIQRSNERDWLTGPTNYADETEISRNGRRALFTYRYGLRLVDLETHELLGQWPYRYSRMLSPEGDYLLCRAGNSVDVMDPSAKTAKIRSVEHGGPIAGAAFNTDGSNFITVGVNGQAQIWDTRSWRPLARIHLQDTGSTVRREWRISADGRFLAGWSNGFGNLACWDVRSGRLTRELPFGTIRDFSNFDWRPDGQQFLWVSPDAPGEVELRDADSGWGIAMVLPQQGVVEAVYGPDGRTLATVSQSGIVRVWDLCDREEGFAWQAPAESELDFDLRLRTQISRQQWQNNRASAFEMKTLAGSERFDLQNPKRFLPPGVTFTTGTASPDGTRAITCQDGSDQDGNRRPDRVLKLWDTKNKQLVGKPLEPAEDDRVHWGWRFAFTSVAFSPDSRYFATASDDQCASDLRAVHGLVELHTANDSKAVSGPLKHDGFVFFTAFSPNSDLLVTCCADSTARLWRTKTGEPVGASLRHNDMVTCAAFSADGVTLATASLDGDIRLWDVARRSSVGVIHFRSGHVWDLAFHPNRPLLMASISAQRERKGNWWPGAIKIFDVGSLQEVSPTIEGIDTNDRLQFRIRRDGRIAFGLYDTRTWDITPDPRPAADLVRLAQLYAQHRLDQRGGELGVGKQEQQALWQELREKYPEEFVVSPQAAIHWRIDRLQAMAEAASPVARDLHRRWLAAELIEAGWQPGERGNEHLAVSDYMERLRALACHGRHFEAAVAADALAGRRPTDPEILYDCARLHVLIATVMKADATQCTQHADRALALLSQAVGAGFPLEFWNNRLLDELVAAVAQHRKVGELVAEAIRIGPKAERHHILSHLAVAYLRAGRQQEVEALVKETVAQRSANVSYSHSLAYLGEALVNSGNVVMAEPILRDCLAIREAVSPDGWWTPYTESFLGEALAGQKKYGEAEPRLIQSYQRLMKQFPHPQSWKLSAPDRRGATAGQLIRLYEAIGKPDEAAKWRAMAAQSLLAE